jgi:hypothetical protein
VGGGHNGGDLLVRSGNEVGPVARALNATNDTLDAVAGISEEALHTPVRYPTDDENAHCERVLMVACHEPETSIA